MGLPKKDFLKIADFDQTTLQRILQLSEQVKQTRGKPNSYQEVLKYKTLGLFFRKPSTRTRVSFEVAINELGGNSMYLNTSDMQIEKGETREDTARVLSRYLHGLIIRTFEQEEVDEFAACTDFPVINALTDLYHPCQALADFLTIKEYKGRMDQLKIVYVGDGNNVAHSLFTLGSILGNELVLSSPMDYQIKENVKQIIEQNNQKQGGTYTYIENPLKACKNADVIYTDTWTSMGQESEKDKRLAIFADYQVNSALLSSAKQDVIVMHCLPAYRGNEITDEVMDGKNSVVFDQAENRLHTQKALLISLYE